MTSKACIISSLLSAAVGAAVVILLQSPREGRTPRDSETSTLALPADPGANWHLTVTLSGNDPAPYRTIEVYRTGAVSHQISSVLNQDLLRDPDPVGNLDLYRYGSMLPEATADRIYRLAREVILSHRLSHSERHVRDGTTLSVHVDVGDTGIGISFRHSLRPPRSVLELIAAIDAALPVEHRIGRGDYAVDDPGTGTR